MRAQFSLLTLNAHSHAEPDYERKLHQFVHGVAKLQPDIIALQEASQSGNALPVADLQGYTPAANDILIAKDNHVKRIAELLQTIGVHYHWTWLPIKQAYGDLAEGIALLSLLPIQSVHWGGISQTNDPSNWRRRMLLGIQTADTNDTWYFCTHMARWDDPMDDFRYQWEQTKTLLPNARTLWLMGDFNNPAEVRGEGYDLMAAGGWQDTFVLAREKDNGITVQKPIDGWRDTHQNAMRIDQIWCSRKTEILRSMVVFNGDPLPVVSDHYGVMATMLQNGKEQPL